MKYMKKIDYKKELKHLYNPSSKEVVTVEVPEMNFLMIDGQGDPNTAKEYKDAVEALFFVSYTLKFIIKKGKTAMIMQPENVMKELVNESLEQVKKNKNLSALLKIRFENFNKELSTQIIHIGSFSAEGPIITKIHAFAKERGYKLK